MNQHEQDQALIQQLKAELSQKDNLIKEAYHRVKNNLQVVLSLLSLQAGASPNSELKDFLLQVTPRIQAMVLVHQMLYQSDNLTSLPMKEYIKKLVKYIYKIYNVDPAVIVCHMEIDEIGLNIDRAIIVGLIVNELISNAFKYAFPKQKSGNITISLRQQAQCMTLSISDNGVGMKLPNLSTTTTMGMRLVASLTKQLNGEVKLDSKPDQGTCFTVKFDLTSKVS